MYSLPVKRLLDGELTLEELPPELREEGIEALRLIGSLDRSQLSLSSDFSANVMATVRRHAKSPAQRARRWLRTPQELRLRVRRSTVVGTCLAAAACLALLLAKPPAPPPSGLTAGRESSERFVFVRFVLYAPRATRVTVAGTFNQWDPSAAPLVSAGTEGLWTTTLAVPVGQHEYAFVVDGQRWVPDPVAPAVDDGFGRRNSVIAVTAQGARTL